MPAETSPIDRHERRDRAVDADQRRETATTAASTRYVIVVSLIGGGGTFGARGAARARR
jgi:hypothetical protein